MVIDLSKKTAIVTGSTGGIGLAIAKAWRKQALRLRLWGVTRAGSTQH